ncbi:MAG: OmpA family protein [Pseudomonadota bacterium]
MPDQKLPQPFGLPRRIVLGSIMAAGLVVFASSLGYLGYGEAPKSADFRFSRGTDFAPGENAAAMGMIAQYIVRSDIGFHVTGHTGTTGDSAANLTLSQTRADLVRQMMVDQGVSADRILSSVGVGGGAPLPRSADQTDREYQRGLSRVTITAVRLP